MAPLGRGWDGAAGALGNRAGFWSKVTEHASGLSPPGRIDFLDLKFRTSRSCGISATGKVGAIRGLSF